MTCLLSEAAAPGVLARAWDHVRRKASAPGVDRVTVEAFAADAERALAALSGHLLSGTYRPKPARRVHLPDDPQRPIAIPTVVDRIVQRAVALTLGPRLDPTFSDAALAYRPGRGVRQALERVEAGLRAGRRWFLRTDITKFFDRVSRERLDALLAETGADRGLRRLVARLLAAGVFDGASVLDPARGTPQGSALSPLLSNLYLRDLDRLAAGPGRVYLRYADDILVLADDRDTVADALVTLGGALQGIGLALSPRKTSHGHVGRGFSYLGAHFDLHGRGLAERTRLALDERLEGHFARADMDAARRLMADAARWYGAVSVERITSLPVLATLASDAPPDLIARLGLRRRALGAGDASAAVRLGMLDAFSLAGGKDAADAAAMDLMTLLSSDPSPEHAARIRATLGLVADRLPPLDGLAAALAQAGRAELADAVRRALQLPDRLAGLAPPDQVLRRLLDCMAGHADRHAIEVTDPRGHRRLQTCPGPLSAQTLGAHLAGRLRAGVHPVRSDGTVRLAELQVRPLRAVELARVAGRPGEHDADLSGRALDHALAAQRTLRSWGFPALIDAMACGGARVLLVFDRPLEMRHAFRLLRHLEADLGEPPPALLRHVVPSQDLLRRPPGPIVALPCDRPRRTGEPHLLDPDGRSAADPFALLASFPLASAAHARRFGLPGTERAASSAPGPERHPALREATQIPRLLAGCAVIRELFAKASALGRLEPEDRATVIESAGHLATDRVPLTAFLTDAAGATSHGLSRRFARLTAHPISCTRVRTRHPLIANEVGCDCRFQGIRAGIYATPVLHVLRPAQVPVFAPRLKPRRPGAQSGAPPARSAGTEPVTAHPSPPPAPSTVPAPPPPPPPVPAEPGARPRAPTAAPTPAEFAAALAKLRRTRAQLDASQRGVTRAERHLDALFAAAGVDRVQTPDGLLTRIPGPNPRFVLEC